jgi:hypothetical protein
MMLPDEKTGSTNNQRITQLLYTARHQPSEPFHTMSGSHKRGTVLSHVICDFIFNPPPLHAEKKFEKATVLHVVVPVLARYYP